ncbi:hypothetical protein CC86DRAFT_111833 [Ophiobolus disseminans]|uniref:Uncharacterized protein n=1 Tax=Ophiobolus disseminans TaxID=1469910 RepID=A0A6A6ZI14_9PLEO|nr:hypothetical protein CC86DRAFT_111833 [Ophiobolus disseminans]
MPKKSSAPPTRCRSLYQLPTSAGYGRCLPLLVSAARDCGPWCRRNFNLILVLLGLCLEQVLLYLIRLSELNAPLPRCAAPSSEPHHRVPSQPS